MRRTRRVARSNRTQGARRYLIGRGQRAGEIRLEGRCGRKGSEVGRVEFYVFTQRFSYVFPSYRPKLNCDRVGRACTLLCNPPLLSQLLPLPVFSSFPRRNVHQRLDVSKKALKFLYRDVFTRLRNYSEATGSKLHRLVGVSSLVASIILYGSRFLALEQLR